jgi:predicted O-methyltransferase YrrM
MSETLWTAVDQYLAEQYLQPDATLDATLAASAAAGLPAINVSPAQGKLLHLYVRMIRAKKILEIGTLAGYSAIWMARALPGDGKLITLEFDPRHAEVARQNFLTAGVADRVELRVGRAIDHLPRLHTEHAGPFDLIFIDADKPSTADYFQWALRLSHPGTIIIVDNVVRNGRIIDLSAKDESVLGIRRFNEAVRSNRQVTATAIQTVGSKGYDGFTILLVNDPGAITAGDH